MEAQFSRLQGLPSLLIFMLLIAEFSSVQQSIAEICGKGSCRHRGNRAIMPSGAKQPHSTSLDMPLQLLPSNAFRLTKYSDEDEKYHSQPAPQQKEK